MLAGAEATPALGSGMAAASSVAVSSAVVAATGAAAAPPVESTVPELLAAVREAGDDPAALANVLLLLHMKVTSEGELPARVTEDALAAGLGMSRLGRLACGHGEAASL